MSTGFAIAELAPRVTHWLTKGLTVVTGRMRSAQTGVVSQQARAGRRARARKDAPSTMGTGSLAGQSGKSACTAEPFSAMPMLRLT